MSRRRVALLRGINIGKAKRVAMSDLRALVTSLGYTEVQTLLNSGNVVFTEPACVRGDAAARIEQAMARELTVSSRVAVLTATELDAIVVANPLLPLMDNPSRMQVAVLMDGDDARALAPLLKTRWLPEALALGPRAAYVWCPAGVIDSAALKAIGKTIDNAVTVRTWSTMLELQALACAPGGPPDGTHSTRAPRRKDRA